MGVFDWLKSQKEGVTVGALIGGFAAQYGSKWLKDTFRKFGEDMGRNFAAGARYDETKSHYENLEKRVEQLEKLEKDYGERRNE